MRSMLATIFRSERPATDAQLVVHLTDAEHALDEVLGAMLGGAIGHGAAQHHVAAGDLDLDLAGVDARVRRQPLADVLLDARVVAPVSLRAATGVRPARQLAATLARHAGERAA